MKNIVELIRKCKNFVDDEVWHIEETPLGQANRRLFALVKIVIMTVRGFLEDKATIRASALTYFTMLSIIPVIALAFAIAKGFGLEEMLEDYIRESFGSDSTIGDYIIDFASNSLENAKGGVIAGVGIVMLLYSVFKLLNNIEDAFNKMWCIKESRTLNRKVTDYVCIMIFAPILLLVSSSATVFLKTALMEVFDGELSQFQTILIRLMPFVLMWIVFSMLYMVMPNTRVTARAAIISGVITGTVFEIVQWVYITFQIGMNNAGAIYGSFAFLPLLLAWLQLTWTIVLAGCKVSFAIQNVSKYSMEHGSEEISATMQKKVAVLTMQKIVTNFMSQNPPKDGLTLANEMEISQTVLYQTIDRLKEAHLVAEVTTEKDEARTFIPAIDVNMITTNLICRRLETLGDDKEFHIKRDEAYARLSEEFDLIAQEGRKAHGNEPLVAQNA